MSRKQRIPASLFIQRMPLSKGASRKDLWELATSNRRGTKGAARAHSNMTYTVYTINLRQGQSVTGAGVSWDFVPVSHQMRVHLTPRKRKLVELHESLSYIDGNLTIPATLYRQGNRR